MLLHGRNARNRIGDNMANLHAISKKLQTAILRTGLVIKLNTSQFYSPEQCRMITAYVLSTPTWQRREEGWVVKDYQILRTCSQVEVVECLKNIWEQIRDKAGG